jgi:hypothetical protein
MKLLRLTLRNFCQFHGEHVVDFSARADLNVTIVTAGNALGKTTLTASLLWAFYGEADLLPEFWFLKQPINLEHANGSLPESDCSAEVEVDLQIGTNRFRIRRSISLEQQKKAKGLSSVTLHSSSSEQSFSGSQAEIGIRALISEPMVRLSFGITSFFFNIDGSGMGRVLEKIIQIDFLESMKKRATRSVNDSAGPDCAQPFPDKCVALIDFEINRRRLTFAQRVNEKQSELGISDIIDVTARLQDDLSIHFYQKQKDGTLQACPRGSHGTSAILVAIIAMLVCLHEAAVEVAPNLVEDHSTCGSQIPLVLDSPFGFLDCHRRKCLLDILARCRQQMVLLIGENESSEVYGAVNLTSKVGRAYELEFDPAVERTIIRQSPVSRLSIGEGCRGDSDEKVPISADSPAWNSAEYEIRCRIEQLLAAERLAVSKRFHSQLAGNQRRSHLHIA